MENEDGVKEIQRDIHNLSSYEKIVFIFSNHTEEHDAEQDFEEIKSLS